MIVAANNFTSVILPGNGTNLGHLKKTAAYLLTLSQFFYSRGH